MASRELYGATVDEREQLAAANIKSANDVWSRIGSDPEEGMSIVAHATGLNEARLCELVEEDARRFVPPGRGSWIGRHWLDWVVVTGVVLVGGLGMRAAGFLPEPFLLLRGSKAWIAGRTIERGDIIERDDAAVATVPASELLVSAGDDVTGLIAGSRIRRGQPISTLDVRRLQAVSMRNLTPGAVIGPKDVKLKWTTYRRGAALNLSDVLGKTPAFPLPKGQPIRTRWLR